MRKYLLFSIIVFVSLLTATPAWAACTGSSPSWTSTPDYASVNTCVGNASDGDTINISAGSAAWTSTLNVVKSVIIQGAGIGNTTITNSVSNHILISMSGTSKTIKVLDMTINQTVSGDTGTIYVGGISNQVAIGRIKFEENSRRSITWSGTFTYGVIFDCEFHNTVAWEASAIQINPDNWDGEWATAMSWGTSNAVFIENNYFNYGPYNGARFALDHKHGSRVVFRYNTVKNTLVGNHGCDSVVRSGMQFEVYHNAWTVEAGTYIDYAIGIRGGSLIVHDNTFGGAGTYNQKILITNYRSQSGCGELCSSCMFANKPWCDGNQSIDGNTGVHGYPCRDQPGVGANQASWPLYQWNNGVADFTRVSWQGGTDYSSDHMQLNRDYCNHDTFSSCGTKGAWSYSAYTYPHPLRSETPQTCTYTYSAWEACQSDNTQTRTVISSSPSGCTETPILTQSCVYTNFLPEQYIQAETGTLSGMQTGTSGSDTYVYTAIDNTGSVKFTFDISQAGQYKMEAKVNNNNDGGQNSFFVGLDNETAQSNEYYGYGIFPLATGFSWDNVSRWGNGLSGDPPISEFDPMTWNLSAGIHAFTFYGREANTWLDQIILKRVTADTTPPAAPSGVVVN